MKIKCFFSTLCVLLLLAVAVGVQKASAQEPAQPLTATWHSREAQLPVWALKKCRLASRSVATAVGVPERCRLAPISHST